MKTRIRQILAVFLFSGVLMIPSHGVYADTILLHSGEQIKGLVVEEHADRIIFSTADGEVPVLRRDIKMLDVDDPAFGMLSLGRALEQRGRYSEALAYYDRAVELNPELTQAKRAAIGIRSRLFTLIEAGPLRDISKQEDLQAAYEKGTPVDQLLKERQKDEARVLWDRLGVSLEGQGQWIQAARTKFGGYSHRKGIRQGDRLVGADGRSLRYLSVRAVTEALLKPRFSTMILIVERVIVFPKEMLGESNKSLGFETKLEYEGLEISKVKKGSVAERLGLKEGDQLVEVNGQQTRYMSHRKAGKLIRDKKIDRLSVTINRNVTITRK